MCSSDLGFFYSSSMFFFSIGQNAHAVLIMHRVPEVSYPDSSPTGSGAFVAQVGKISLFLILFLLFHHMYHTVLQSERLSHTKDKCRDLKQDGFRPSILFCV